MKSDDATGIALNARAAGLVDLARGSLGDMSDAQRIAGLHALRARLAGERRARRARFIAFALAGAGTCAATAWGVATHHAGRSAAAAGALALHVEGAALQSGGAVEAGSAHPVLRFSDGSEIALAQNARVHVRSIDAHGARVTLDGGEAHVYVVHANDTHWSFDAGPFVVGVTGTAFGLAWREDTQRLDVRLENGTVVVSGPVSDAPLSLRAGQWLTVRGSEVLIRRLSADESGDARAIAPVEERVDAPALPSPGADKTRETAREGRRASAERPEAAARRAIDPTDGTTKHHWVIDLANGQFDSIVSQATALGLDASVSKSDPDELAALADAARYTRQEGLARGALLALRRRFPGSEHAHSAAFHLGKLADSEQDHRAARSWFETYLTEAPNGTYAPEALGRKMLLVQLLEGSAAARSLADTYLRRFPSGTYADAARSLSAAP
jgi:TolA-binding protein